MFLLDNNAQKLFIARDENTLRRVEQYAGKIWLSSVAAEELLTGSLSGLNRARSPRNSLSLAQAHADFAQALEDVRLFPMLIYSEAAESIFKTFSPATIRNGSQDCRIAAQTIAHNMVVVTRNLRDFEATGAPCEDWSVA